MVSIDGLTKSYGRLTALSDVSLSVRQGRSARADRPERRRQDHAVRVPGRASCPIDAGTIRRRLAQPLSAARPRIAHLLPARRHRAVAGADGALGARFHARVLRRPARDRCATRSIDAPRSRAAARLADRHAVEGPAQARAARDRPADAAADAAGRRAVRRPRPAPERDVGAALRAHAAAGRTLFLSIHQISDAARVCDRFVLLSGGRVCGEGTLDELARRCADARPMPRRRISKRCSLRSRKTRLRRGSLEKEWRELLASRAWWVMLAADRAARRRVVHQRGAHLRRAERAERHGRRRRRSVLAAGRRLGADLQRLRARGGVPAAVRRHPPRRRRSAERRAEARAAAADAGVRAHRAKALVLLGGWIIASLPPLVAIVLWTQLRRQHLPAGAGDGRRRPPAQRRADDRARAPRPRR